MRRKLLILSNKFWFVKSLGFQILPKLGLLDIIHT